MGSTENSDTVENSIAVRVLTALLAGTAQLLRRVGPRLLLVLLPTLAIARLLELAAAAVGTLIKSSSIDISDDLEVSYTSVATWNQWLSVALVALSLLVTLTGFIICWRIIALDQAARRGDSADLVPSLTQTLSLTMLGFLGVYSVFDGVDQIANRVMGDSAILSGGDVLNGVFLALNPETLGQTIVVIIVIVAAFVLRRVAEAVADRRGLPWVGFVAAGLEAFYLLAMFVVGRSLLGKLQSWLATRQFQLWQEEAINAVSVPLRQLGISLPDALGTAWAWFWQIGWPYVIGSLLEPLLWLALAGLALRGRMITFRDLLAEGKVSDWISRHGPAGLAQSLNDHQELVAQAQDAAFGDLDDKYLPLFETGRRILRAGPWLVGIFVLLYAGLGWLRSEADHWCVVLIGPGPLAEQEFWLAVPRMLVGVAFEGIRIALLSVAFGLVESGAAGVPQRASVSGEATGPQAAPARPPDAVPAPVAGVSVSGVSL
ncbi:MAG: hypothetical protein LBV30_02930 [Propionibacteriaceae bacterium]|nr:hypothetical protein [Propionibacteriaceae bacterium]